jgi:hypothetical protein
MRSKFIISSLVAFIAAVGLIAAPALAEVGITGRVNTSFGMQSEDDGTDSTSFLTAPGEIRVQGKKADGPLTGQFMLRMRNSDLKQFNTIRMQVGWAATDSVTVTVAPSHFGFAGAGVNANADYFRANVGGNAADGAFPQYSVPVLGVNVGLGGMAVGFGIVAECGDLCFEKANLADDDQTIVLHLKGSAGTIAYNFAFATGSGTATDSSDAAAFEDVSVGGSALQGGVTVDLGGMKLGFDYASRTTAAAEDAGHADDSVWSFLGLAFFLGSDLGVDFHSFSTTVGDADPDATTEIDAHYKIKAGDSSYYGVEFRNQSQTDGTTDTSAQYIGLGMRVNY